MYDAYTAHRQKNRSPSPGGSNRIFPTFRTNGNRIVPPEDVPSSSDPLYNNDNLIWAGREVTQLKRFGEESFYVG